MTDVAGGSVRARVGSTIKTTPATCPLCYKPIKPKIKRPYNRKRGCCGACAKKQLRQQAKPALQELENFRGAALTALQPGELPFDESGTSAASFEELLLGPVIEELELMNFDEEFKGLSEAFRHMGLDVSVNKEQFLQHVRQAGHTERGIQLLRIVHAFLQCPPVEMVPVNSDLGRVRSCPNVESPTGTMGPKRGSADIRALPSNLTRTRSGGVAAPTRRGGAQPATASPADSEDNDRDDDDDDDDEDDNGDDHHDVQEKVVAAVAKCFVAFLKDPATMPHDRVFASANAVPADATACTGVADHKVLGHEFSQARRGLVVTMQCRAKYKHKNAVRVKFVIAFSRQRGIFRICEVLEFVPSD